MRKQSQLLVFGVGLLACGGALAAVTVGGYFVLFLGLGLCLYTLWSINRTGPKLSLNGDDALHVDRIGKNLQIGVLSLRLINKPTSKRHGDKAEGVSARFMVTRDNGSNIPDLPSLAARWSDTVEPSNLARNQVSTDLLAVDFSVNSQRQIDLVIKPDNSPDCYLFNNDSYNYTNGINPQWALPPGKYRVLIDVSGVGIFETFEGSFENPGSGKSVEALSIRLSHRDPIP